MIIGFDSGTAITVMYVSDGTALRQDQVRFDSWPSEAQLAAAFPKYDVYAALPKAVLSGVAIASSGTPSLSGTYAIDSNALAQINAVITYILVNDSFPNAAASLPWPDTEGNIHTFSSIAAFKAFATAVANYVAAVNIYANTGQGSLPSRQITIA